MDKLVPESKKSKKVTVGVSTENDARLISKHLNGVYVSGQQIYVEDMKKADEKVSMLRKVHGPS